MLLTPLLGALLLAAPPGPGLSPAYLEILQQYRGGQAAAAYTAVQALTTDAVQEEVRSLARADAETLRATPVRAAVMLHTDLWLQDPSSLAGQGHEKIARAFLELVPPGKDGDGFVQRWLGAAAASAQQGNRWPEALALAEEGARRFPTSPWMMMLAGSIAESIGSPATAASDARDVLARARKHYAEARRLDAHLPGLDLRAGRVAWRLGMTDDARRLLEAAVAGKDPDARFLAHVYLGRVKEDGRDLEGSAKEYRAANVLRPRNYVGHLALSHILRASGDAAGARKEFLAAAEDDLGDPYWEYPWGYSGSAEDWVAALQKEAAR